MLTCVCSLRCKLLLHAICAGLVALGGLLWGIGADQSARVSSDLFLVDGRRYFSLPVANPYHGVTFWSLRGTDCASHISSLKFQCEYDDPAERVGHLWSFGSRLRSCDSYIQNQKNFSLDGLELHQIARLFWEGFSATCEVTSGFDTWVMDAPMSNGLLHATPLSLLTHFFEGKLGVFLGAFGLCCAGSIITMVGSIFWCAACACSCDGCCGRKQTTMQKEIQPQGVQGQVVHEQPLDHPSSPQP